MTCFAVVCVCYSAHQASNLKAGRQNEMLPEHLREVMDDQIIIVYKNAV